MKAALIVNLWVGQWRRDTTEGHSKKTQQGEPTFFQKPKNILFLADHNSHKKNRKIRR